MTFILAFSRRNLLPEQLASTALVGLALLLTLTLVAKATEPTAGIVLLHLCFLFVAGMVCHNKLAAERPDASRLPGFYLCVAIGGMIGGLFNTLLAPTIFNTIVEYPLVIVLACLIRPWGQPLSYFHRDGPLGQIFEAFNSVLADLAKRNDALSVRFVDGEHNPVTGKDPSEWVVMARSSPAFDSLAQKPNWRLLEARAESIAWTDDFSNILSVFRWY